MDSTDYAKMPFEDSCSKPLQNLTWQVADVSVGLACLPSAAKHARLTDNFEQAAFLLPSI